jgi:hypothetical protein
MENHTDWYKVPSCTFALGTIIEKPTFHIQNMC